MCDICLIAQRPAAAVADANRCNAKGHIGIVTSRNVCPCFFGIMASVFLVQVLQRMIAIYVNKELRHIVIVSS